MTSPQAIIINNTYPAVAHFEVDAGSFLVLEPDDTYLVFVDTGIPGPAGSSSSYTHNQNSASAVWTINHNLGISPRSVRLLTVGGVEMDAEVIETSLNQVVVYFNLAIAGKAIIS